MLEFMFDSEFERTIVPDNIIETIQVRAFILVTHFATPGRFDPFKSIVDPPSGHEWDFVYFEEYCEGNGEWSKAKPDVEKHFQEDYIQDRVYERIDQEIYNDKVRS